MLLDVSDLNAGYGLVPVLRGIDDVDNDRQANRIMTRLLDAMGKVDSMSAMPASVGAEGAPSSSAGDHAAKRRKTATTSAPASSSSFFE